MNHLLSGLSAINSKVVVLQRWLLCFLMALLTAAMLAEIITRYFFGSSLFGMEQFIGFSAVWIYFVGSAYGSYERTHIKAEFIASFVKSPRKLYLIRSAAAVLSTAMSAVFAKWSIDFCVESIQMGETTPTHSVPMIIFQAALPVGAVLMIVYFLWEAIDYLVKAVHTN